MWVVWVVWVGRAMLSQSYDSVEKHSLLPSWGRTAADSDSLAGHGQTDGGPA